MSGLPSGRPASGSSCSALSGSPDSARAAESAHVGDELADLLVRQRGAEGRHAGTPDRRATVLDDVAQVLVGALMEARGVGEVPGTDQEEGGAPGAPPVRAVARHAEPVVEALATRGTARRTRRVQQRGEASRENANRRDPEDEGQDGPPHGAEGKADIPLAQLG